MDEVASVTLEKPLLVRNPDTYFISVNFDPKVCHMGGEGLILNQIIDLRDCS